MLSVLFKRMEKGWYVQWFNAGYEETVFRK